MQPIAIERTFRAAFEAEYASISGVTCTSWTDKERYSLNSAILKKWDRNDAEGAHAFIEWVVRDWHAIRGNLFGWMKKPAAPEIPEVRFIVAHRARLVPAFMGRKQDQWIAQIDSHEERRMQQLMRKEGMTEDQAKMKLAEERAVVKLRDEMVKNKREVTAAW